MTYRVVVVNVVGKVVLVIGVGHVDVSMFLWLGGAAGKDALREVNVTRFQELTRRLCDKAHVKSEEKATTLSLKKRKGAF